MDPRYPIGKFQKKASTTEAERTVLIGQIAEAPSKMRGAVEGLEEKQLDTPYREGGWTVRQVVHHVPDSHMNAYIRCKLALTQQGPTINAYDEKLWAELADAKSAPAAPSLTLLENLHRRWVMFLKSLRPEDFAKACRHPEHGLIDIDFLVQLYAWHGRHHVAQITSLRERMGW